LYISKKEEHLLLKHKLFKRKYKKKIKQNNEKYTNQKLKENNSFLSDINNHSLDINQRKIILSEEDSTLVIAGAGSGKTLTIVGKVLYLIKQGINPKDILLISFTNEASNNLKKQLSNYNINIMTFHKLGRTILKDNNIPIKLTSKNTLKNIITKNINQFEDLDVLLPDMKFITIGYDDMTELQKIIILNSNEVKNLKKLLLTFINLFKSNNYNEEYFTLFLKQNEKEKGYLYDKNKTFLLLAKKIYKEYTYYLEKNKQIDFHDMINQSIDIVKQKGIYNYKYIIIDEYQDTSLVKCNLIKTIKEKTNSKLLVVGDDFQSIYRFTGTNLKVFINFSKYFKYTKTFKLEKTYRNSKELLQITTKFILKNKNQISKRLYSEKHNKNSIYIYYYDNNQKEVLDKVIKNIPSKDFLIIGRNNSDIKDIKQKAMTVHKSKGLEADNVIIVGLEDKINGFPNKIRNDNVLKYVLNDQDNYPYEEERRLFYVALTRTKNNNYLLVNKNKPSIFVEELIKDNPSVIIDNDNLNHQNIK